MLEAAYSTFVAIGPLLLLALAFGFAIYAVKLVRLRRSLSTLARDARAAAHRQYRPPLDVSGDAMLADLRAAIVEMGRALRAQVGVAEAEHEQLAAILQTMADGVIVLDPEGRVVVINEAAAQLVRCRPEEARGRSLVDVARDYELVSAVRAALREATPQRRLIELGHPARQVQLVCTPLVRSATEKQALLVLQDVTELQRTDTIRREFVANVSHELRTPVTSLKALAETLADGALDDPPAARSFVDRMQVEADRLAQLVEELLELARVEGGTAGRGEAERIDMSALAARAAERLRPLADRRHVRLTVEPGPPVEAAAEPERLERAILNLVDNALKFTPPDGEVRVRCWQEQSEALVSVTDSGMGIRAEDQARVFERFYKTDRARASAGAGLGLAIAKHTVTGMGGRIWAASAEGRGSTFFVALPAAEKNVFTTPTDR